MIAFIGMGHLGANYVKAMLKKGESVNVWNRTASKAKTLEADGAKAFDSVVDAVKDAERVHLTLKDDASVDEILEQAEPGLMNGAIIIDHTTTTAQGAAERTEQWRQRGFTYVHAPVFMGPVNALESTGYMLISGDKGVVDKLEPVLSKMTGKLLYFGPDPAKAAGIKLIGNLFLIAMVGGLSDLIALSGALGITKAELFQLFDIWNPGVALPSRLKKMTSGDFDEPSWELQMARKDAGLMMHEATEGGKLLNVIPYVADLMDSWIAKGDGNKDWTIIGKQ